MDLGTLIRRESERTTSLQPSRTRYQTALALGEVEKIERLLAILPDSPAIYAEWCRLVVKHDVLGVKVHDARLVAAMNVHGVKRSTPTT